MSRPVLILGSGKTARDIGLRFHIRGQSVVWHAGTAYAGALESFVQRIERRASALGNGASPTGTMHVGCLGDTLHEPPVAVIESRAENIEAKRAAFEATRPNIDQETLLFTNSSSILPDTIGVGIAGLHFFYPIALTELVELIIPSDWTDRRIEAAEAFVRGAGLHRVRQTCRNAFYVNRLLLPLQAEATRLFMAGYSIKDIDSASVSKLLPLGLWSAADEIGLDVLLAGIENYVSRMPPFEAAAYSGLIDLLRAWTDAGFLGKKNKKQLRKADDATLRSLVPDATCPPAIKHPISDGHFEDLLRSAARRFLEDGTCTLEALSFAISSAFGSETELLASKEIPSSRHEANDATVATFTLDISTQGETASEVLRQLDRVLEQPDIKALAVTLLCSSSPTPQTAEAIAKRLARADLPVTAVFEPNAVKAVREAAEACLFQAPAGTEGLKNALRNARQALKTLTEKRPIHVIRAVVESIRNAGELPIEEALLEETRLFCALSRRNRVEGEAP